MVAIEVGLDQKQVTPDHFHCRVAEHHLKSVRISTISEVINGEGVAKAVAICFPHSRPLANPY